jgi:hypothetical protein
MRRLPVRGTPLLSSASRVRRIRPPPRAASGADGFDDFVQSMQERICSEAAEADGSGKAFITDKWDRGEGGKYVPSDVLGRCRRPLPTEPSEVCAAREGTERTPQGAFRTC